ncbi:dolichol-phosphate mannosyltransferase [Nitrosopumilus cobalaminigenes]|uniref:Dolichol-phosphate mannosyltransferase n=1 Tax=Nitrosopumilus cobalaminigenes TaxID=1470066 RepID=A0A7D5R5S2_9ARCH|nr:glycosyltransferase family 2 protein [Nitrosopumilus cobalaminigenes]QLH02142.1 dolichol-phosphate mannosyltransferase [Nitrosopumilus cobalaminigenes]
MYSETNLIENKKKVSIILPTYNESQNIIQILKSIEEHLPKNFKAETIVVDDNSPDGTGKIVDDYLNFKKIANNTIDIIHRTTKSGLASAILKGIQHATGEIIVVMDSDFSHPPQIIPKMLESLKKYHSDIVIASRYAKGGSIEQWTLKRKLMSKLATKIAKSSLNVSAKDPMSGFFLFKKNLLHDLKFDGIGYKLLLEILVKTKGAKITEVPYTFTNRKFGSSKLGLDVIFNYGKSVFKLYRYGKTIESQEPRKSIRFISKAARFYTVGLSGFVVNYLVSLLLAGNIPELWFVHANIYGIAASMTTNFFLNKFWTFEDRSLKPKKIIVQFLKFIGFSSLGALLQLGIVFSLIDQYEISFPVALFIGVLSAAFGNFILNKKLTFKEKTWD